MQSKVNIFHSLQHASDSEDENDTQNNKAKKIAEKKEQRAQRDEKKQTSTKPTPSAGGPEKPAKENHAKTKAPYKAKGVTDEAHPLDRHSGHNNQAYGEKPKKQGAGRGNWGSYKEDRRPEDDTQAVGEANEENGQEKVEEAPVGITLAEYYQTRQQTSNQPQVNEAKAKITSEQLTKELGTATVLKTKQQQQIDDKKVGKKKDHLDVNHKAAINSENASLLNFRTGFVEKEYRPRGEGAPETNPRNRGPRTGGPRDKEDAKQEETTQGQTTEGQTVEGGQATDAVTNEAPNADAQQLASTSNQVNQGVLPQQGQGQDNQNRRRNEGQGGQGGQRGGRGGHRGGDRHQGDRQQGDRQQGDRPQGDRPKKQQGGQGQLNFDDSAFPKLG